MHDLLIFLLILLFKLSQELSRVVMYLIALTRKQPMRGYSAGTSLTLATGLSLLKISCVSRLYSPAELDY